MTGVETIARSVTGTTSQGVEVHGTVLNLTRHLAVFEIYNPTLALRLSEVIGEFRIHLDERVVYSGRAVVHSIVRLATVVVCEATLEEGWLDIPFPALTDLGPKLQAEYGRFIDTSQKSLRVLPEFKLAVADLQMMLLDLRGWLEQVELGVRSRPTGDRAEIEREAILQLAEPVTSTVMHLLEHFELASRKVEPADRPAHMSYMKRQIHPLVLCAPFIHRTFYKPLGYAGDYEMVNMMVRDPFEGGSVFAKILNHIFLNTPPVQAHRDRLVYLIQILTQETLRAMRGGRPARILNLGCGPAKEVQDFIAHSPVSDNAQFNLLDFNDETVAYTSRVLGELRRQHGRTTGVRLAKKSVNQVIKESARPRDDAGGYDLVYCAGLFDYLDEPVCRRLLNIFHSLLAPGGLLVATNVDDSNPSRSWMEFVLDWHLIYRNGRQFEALAPEDADPDDVTVRSVGTGVNIFIEVRKPAHG